jgi:hypothetical protein
MATTASVQRRLQIAHSASSSWVRLIVASTMTIPSSGPSIASIEDSGPWYAASAVGAKNNNAQRGMCWNRWTRRVSPSTAPHFTHTSGRRASLSTTSARPARRARYVRFNATNTASLACAAPRA